MKGTTTGVPLADGAQLCTDVRLPDGAGRYPAMLFRTPYLRSNEFLPLHPGDDLPAAVVLQDVRGRHGSSGEFDLGAHDVDDGAAAIDWVTRQPWSDGRVAMYGISYAGHTQLQAARGRPGALAAIAPIRCPAWWRGLTLHEGGALQLALACHWLPLQAAESPGCPDDARLRLLRMALTYDQVCDYPAGVATANGVLNLDRLAAHPELHRRPYRDRPEYDATPQYAHIWQRLFEAPLPALWADDAGPREDDHPDCPTLLMGGWYDCWSIDTLRMFQALARRRPADLQRLVMTPFSHAPEPAGTLPLGADAGRFDDWQSIAWTRELLLAEGSRFREMAPVTYFMINANRWMEADSWPPPGSGSRRLFLAAGDGRDNGRLHSLPADGSRGVDFVYDPRDPMPTMGGAQLGLPAGPIEQSALGPAHRQDVCSFTGDVLEAPVDLAGPVTADIHLATDGRDTDVVVKLLDVFPDGRAYNIADGIVRGRFLGGTGAERLLVPGAVNHFRVHCWDIAYRVDAGHRLRCDITSSSFPRFDPNANTGAPLGSDRAEDLRVARQTVLTGASHPSSVTITVIPG